MSTEVHLLAVGVLAQEPECLCFCTVSQHVVRLGLNAFHWREDALAHGHQLPLPVATGGIPLVAHSIAYRIALHGHSVLVIDHASCPHILDIIISSHSLWNEIPQLAAIHAVGLCGAEQVTCESPLVGQGFSRLGMGNHEVSACGVYVPFLGVIVLVLHPVDAHLIVCRTDGHIGECLAVDLVGVFFLSHKVLGRYLSSSAEELAGEVIVVGSDEGLDVLYIFLIGAEEIHLVIHFRADAPSLVVLHA